MSNVVAMFLGVALFAIPLDVSSADNNVDSYYSEGIIKCGGEMFDSLVSKIIEMDDSIVTKTGRNGHIQALESFGGIGNIVYHRNVREIKSVRWEKTGEVHGDLVVPYYGGTMSVGSIRGDTYGKVEHTRTKVGNWVVDAPKTFRVGIDKLVYAARKNHAKACCELGAAIFSEGARGVMGMDEYKMYKYFKRAAELGIDKAKIPQAFCLYYGIGTSKNQKLARTLCKGYAAEHRPSGWVLRRANESLP